MVKHAGEVCRVLVRRGGLVLIQPALSRPRTVLACRCEPAAVALVRPDEPEDPGEPACPAVGGLFDG